MRELDITNKAIVECLRIDAVATNRTVARALGVSEETVRRRILGMKKSGMLQFGVTIAAEAEGMGVSAMINVEADGGTAPNLFRDFGHLGVHLIRNHITVEGNHVYEIASPTIGEVHRAMKCVKAIVGVRNATVTFLHTNGNLRI